MTDNLQDYLNQNLNQNLTNENLNPAPGKYGARFLACMPFIKQEEGGYSDNPHDPGGATNCGITQRELTAYLISRGQPPMNVKNLSWGISIVDDIYYSQYWLPNCVYLRPGEDLCLFNFGINAGVVEAVKIIQAAVRVPVDGHYGVITQAACLSADPKKLIYAFTLKEESFYRSLSTFKYFGKDWIGRSQRCEDLALSMLPGATNSTPVAAKPQA